MRILLVDGDGELLQTWRRAFGKRHRSWEVLLAPSGGEALQVLARDPIDIVFSELRLPDMAGAELLHSVREAQPGAVRIGLADSVVVEVSLPERVEKVAGDFHRLFAKPVDPGLLIDVVESLNIEDDETNVRAIRAFVGGLGRIPSLPSLYMELVALLEREDAGMGDIARLIRRDLGVASQVLKLVNSGHFAANRPVTEIGQAVAMLGVDSIRAMVLFRGLISSLDAHNLYGLDLEKLWLHSFEVAVGTRKLAILEGQTDLADLAFSVGLLHDLGMVVLATEPVGRYRALLERARSGQIPLTVLEHETYGVDHTQIGAHLLNLWGLPPTFCRPIREHHAPPTSVEGTFPLSAALHLADARHGGGAAAGIFADGLWGLHPNVQGDAERFARWKECLAENSGAPGQA